MLVLGLLLSYTDSIEGDDQTQASGSGDNQIVKERTSSDSFPESHNEVEKEDDSRNGKGLTKEERQKRNKRILEKYQMMAELMAEIMPGIYENNRTEAYYKFLKKFKKLKRRRRRKQKRCERKYTAVERWLSHQLVVTKKRAYKHRISEKCKSTEKRQTIEGMNTFEMRWMKTG